MLAAVGVVWTGGTGPSVQFLVLYVSGAMAGVAAEGRAVKLRSQCPACQGAAYPGGP
jgi:hypothetical protein